MDTENLVIDNGCDREAVEALNELLPESEAIPALTLIIKPIYPIDGAALVVSAEKEKVLWVLNLVSHHKANHFKVLLSSVNVIAQEKIVRFWREVSNLKYTQKVNIFSVDVARDDEGHIELQKIWLADENLLTFFYKHFYLRFLQIYGFDSHVR